MKREIAPDTHKMKDGGLQDGVCAGEQGESVVGGAWVIKS